MFINDRGLKEGEASQIDRKVKIVTRILYEYRNLVQVNDSNLCYCVLNEIEIKRTKTSQQRDPS